MRYLSSSSDTSGYFEIHTPQIIAKYAAIYIDGDKNIAYSNATTYKEAKEILALAARLNPSRNFKIVERSLFARFCEPL